MFEEIVNVTWKSTLVFFLLIFLARLLGKKLLSKMNFFDFVIGITIGTISGAFVVEQTRGFYVLLSPIIITATVLLFGFINAKSRASRKVFEGEPVVVIQTGKILEKNMLLIRYHMDDLEKQLRGKGIFDFKEVEFAVLEPHGELSALRKSQYMPLTPKDLDISTEYKGLATAIIKDGKVFAEHLRQNNLDFAWLYQELRERGIKDISDILYASLNTDGSLYIDLKEDKVDYVPKLEE